MAKAGAVKVGAVIASRMERKAEYHRNKRKALVDASLDPDKELVNAVETAAEVVTDVEDDTIVDEITQPTP